MKLDSETLDYLHGRKFSNGHAFDLGNKGHAMRRSERILQICKDQHVLHIGCCDHIPLIEYKRKNGLYLHENLCRTTNTCVGVDTNKDGVTLLRDTGFPETYTPDCAPKFCTANGKEQPYDICLLADVIEHVGNPVEFLSSMMRFDFNRIIIITPNGFRWSNALIGSENINTDHRFWFTPYTLCKVAVDAGYEPQIVELCHGDYVSWRGALAARLTNMIPKWRESIILHAIKRKN